MRYKLFLLLASLAFYQGTHAQKKWNLLQCVEYAMTNNITVKQTDLQTKLASLTYDQSKWSRWPSLSFSVGPTVNNGPSQDPTTYSLITQSSLSANPQLQTSVEIFNWFSKKNTIAANQWAVMAAQANVDKLKNDIALTVANSYLQILLAKEQEKIAGVQLEQSKAQLYNTRKMVDAGALPELNAAELEAQVARDSSSVISAHGNVVQALLNLKAYMAIDAAEPFEIDEPPVDKIPVEKIADLQPDVVYTLAIANMPQQKANDFKLKEAISLSKASKGAMYPTIGAFGGLSSSYIAARSPAYTKGLTGTYSPTGLKTIVGGIDYAVLTPDYTQTRNGYSRTDAFFSQLNQNFRQSVGLSLSVPIFNGYALKTAYSRSKINIRSLELQRDLDNQTLKQNIYQAYNAAVVALQKFEASKKTVETAERTYSYAKKRYDVGMLGTFELITNQNNLFRAKLEYSVNQFDYVFKMKVLEFYKGQGLKL